MLLELKASPIFGRHLIVMLIIVHLLIGFRHMREVDYEGAPFYQGYSNAETRIINSSGKPGT